jgi:hypothetical protein
MDFRSEHPVEPNRKTKLSIARSTRPVFRLGGSNPLATGGTRYLGPYPSHRVGRSTRYMPAGFSSELFSCCGGVRL